MTNIIVIVVLALVLGLAIRYIVQAKKRGTTCIGCPAGGCCSGSCNGEAGACSCHTESD